MRRIAAIALITGLTATAATTRTADAKPKPLTCEKSTDRFSARQADWAAFTSKSFTDALAREHLTTPKGSLRSIQAESPQLKGARPGATFTMGSGSGAERAIYLRTVQTYGAAEDEFVEDAQSVVHPLVRKETLVGTETHTLCGCGPMGGGAAPPMMAIIYVLPAGATYDAKPIELVYDAKRIDIQWRNIVNGKEEICEPPP
jgi:hypothetical protein